MATAIKKNNGAAMNSIKIVKTATVFAAVLVFCQITIPAHAQFMTPVATEEIADGLYSIRIGARRSIFIVGSDGVIVTDTVNDKSAKLYRAEIAKVTDKPVKYVVYSSSLWGRIRGAQLFKDEGAQIVAQEICAQELAETPHPDVLMPDITFSNFLNVSVGDKSLDLIYLGPNYGFCSPVMVPQPANMMYIVNIVNPPSPQVPWDPTIPNFHLYNLIPWFKAVEAYGADEGIDTVLAAYMSVGRGKDGKPYILSATGDFSLVPQQRMFWEKLFAAVRAEVDAGTRASEIATSIDMSQFEDYYSFNEAKMAVILQRVYYYTIIGR